MKVLELLDEIEEIVDTASGFPLTGKIMIDSEELLEIVKEIRVSLPDEIQQAQWIKEERQRILDDAKAEHDQIVGEAKRQAEALIENDDITVKAKARAAEIMNTASTNCKNLKMSTFDYVDSILYSMQERMEQMNATYFQEMFSKLEDTFDSVNSTLASNRNEIKEMAFRVQNEE